MKGAEEHSLTEQEWLAGDDPEKMLWYLRTRASERKLRLFGLACGPRYWQLPESGQWRSVLETAERFVDGLARTEELHQVAHGLHNVISQPDPWVFASNSAKTGFRLASAPVYQLRVVGSLLCCVFGNPFHPATADPAWLTSTVVSLATAIYDERAFDRMPILADALEDAGCTNADILNHCRQSGEHVRVCWALDLVFSKQ